MAVKEHQYADRQCRAGKGSRWGQVHDAGVRQSEEGRCNLFEKPEIRVFYVSLPFCVSGPTDETLGSASHAVGLRCATVSGGSKGRGQTRGGKEARDWPNLN